MAGVEIENCTLNQNETVVEEGFCMASAGLDNGEQGAILNKVNGRYVCPTTNEECSWWKLKKDRSEILSK